MKCPLSRRLRKAVSCGREGTAVFSRRDGADDEGTGSDFESGCGEAEVVGSSGDYGDNGPHHAALAGAVERTRLQRVMGLPEAQAESQTGADADSGASVAAVPGEVLRLQRAALSREAARSTRYSAELHVGEDGAANRWFGEASQETGITSQAPAEESIAGHDAAH